MIDGFESRILQALHQRLTEEIGTHTAAISSGTAEDFAAYKRQCGLIAGMNNALLIAREIEDDARGIQKGEKS